MTKYIRGDKLLHLVDNQVLTVLSKEDFDDYEFNIPKPIDMWDLVENTEGKRFWAATGNNTAYKELV